MKNLTVLLTLIFGLLLVPPSVFAQKQAEVDKIVSYGEVDFHRPYDKRGLHMFETTKADYDKPYMGRRISFGAGFTQQFQSLKHENRSLNRAVGEANYLKPIKAGFMTSQANLFIDAQLAEGIRLNVTSYMSSRHHNDFWVKGGYIQFDKLPFSGEIWDNLMRYTTVKIGHMEVNYGDAHFRRPDGGQTIYSPFMEGNIMDAFATEIGGEVYLQKDGFFGMLGLTNGMIKGSVDSMRANPADDRGSRQASLILKGGMDKQLNDNARVRLTGSWYHNGGSNGTGLTLYSGDRTGSNYQYAMEQHYNAAGAVRADEAVFASGRFNPGLDGKIDAVMLNAFAKVGGAEFFGTYEIAKGYGRNDAHEAGKDKAKSRTANQFAAEGIYRFGSEENLFIGLRYNIVNADLVGYDKKVKVDRISAGAGWFLTKNILLKGEYVQQNYKDFKDVDYRNGGKFNGLVVEAVVGF